VVPSLYYRMTDEHALDAAQQRLRQQRYWSPSRALGYENHLILRVDFRAGHPPDRIIHDIDHLARRVPTPQAEQHTTPSRPQSDTGEGPG
jgi:hypothetical protein